MEIILQTKSWPVFLSDPTEETSVKSKEQKLEDSNFEKNQLRQSEGNIFDNCFPSSEWIIENNFLKRSVNIW